MPAGINRVAPGDSGNIDFAVSNAADSAGKVDGFRAYLVSPPYMAITSSGSLLGPVSIPPGEAYTFKLHYEVDKASPQGCFRAFVKLAVDTMESNSGVWPDPEDDVTPFDFVVLPSTDSRSQFIDKFRAATNCKKRLASAEVPNRLNRCRHDVIEGLSRIRESTATLQPLYFSPGERNLKDAAVSEVMTAAEEGNTASVLELGFRSDAESLNVLRKLAHPKNADADAILASIVGDNIFRCDELLAKQVAQAKDAMPAAQQALARRGDKSALNEISNNLIAQDPSTVLYAIAAIGYIGDKNFGAALKPMLFHPGFGQEGHRITISFPAMRSLELLNPELADKFENETNGPDERLERWRAWARPVNLH